MTRRLILACNPGPRYRRRGGGPNLAVAQNQPQKEEAPDKPPGVTDTVYTPPLRGAPAGRVGGASRGAMKPPAPLPTIELLAPADHAGQTFRATPALCYFVSRPVAWPMQLTISAPLQPAPGCGTTRSRPPSTNGGRTVTPHSIG